MDSFSALLNALPFEHEQFSGHQFDGDGATLNETASTKWSGIFDSGQVDVCNRKTVCIGDCRFGWLNGRRTISVNGTRVANNAGYVAGLRLTGERERERRMAANPDGLREHFMIMISPCLALVVQVRQWRRTLGAVPQPLFPRLLPGWRPLLILAALVLGVFEPGPVSAGATPENGLYWAPGRPAQLYAIEHQEDRVVLVVMSYDDAGRAEWFTASGPLTAGMLIGTPGHDDADAAYLDAPLHRLSGGPPLDFRPQLPNPVPYFSAAPVGRVTVEFYGSGSVQMFLRYNGQVVTSSLTRFNFGYGGFGQSEFLPHMTCWPDLSGEWVFVDRSELASPARRYKFSQPRLRAWNLQLLPTNDMRCGPGDQTHDVEYRDEMGGAMLRCRQTREDSGSIGIDPATYGCQLIEANEVVFSFEGYYTQLDRIRAWRGTLPDNADRVFNDPDGPPITGFRVR